MTENFRAIIEGAPEKVDGYTIYTDALKQMVAQRNALIADDWRNLEKLASRGLGSAYGSYRLLLRNLGEMHTITLETSSRMSCMLKKYAQNEEKREEFFSNIKQELLEKRPDITPELIHGLDELIHGKIQGNALFKELDKIPDEVEDTNMVNSAVNAVTALGARSLMSLTYAGFYRHYKTISNQDLRKLGNEFLEELESEVDIFEEELDSRIKEIHGDLVIGISPVQAAEALAARIEELLPKFARIQATIRFYAETLKNEGKGTASEEAGVLAVKAGSLTRTAFSAYASAYYLALQSKVVDQDSKVKKAINNADKIAYNTEFPNGRNIEISKVDKLKEDDYVEVAGFVQSIQSGKDSDGKLITQLTLYDPSSKATVVAAGIFVHLLHVGLTKETYCRLSGKWKKQSGVNWGKPAIEIEKLSINQLSKESWKILFLDISDKFIDRWPGGLNISYGLSPHVSGEKEGRSEILGAGELIFKPFIR